MDLIKNRACSEYIDGIETLKMPQDRVPQLKEISNNLIKCTGW